MRDRDDDATDRSRDRFGGAGEVVEDRAAVRPARTLPGAVLRVAVDPRDPGQGPASGGGAGDARGAPDVVDGGPPGEGARQAGQGDVGSRADDPRHSGATEGPLGEPGVGHHPSRVPRVRVPGELDGVALQQRPAQPRVEGEPHAGFSSHVPQRSNKDERQSTRSRCIRSTAYAGTRAPTTALCLQPRSLNYRLRSTQHV